MSNNIPDDMKISEIRSLLKDNDIFRTDTWARIMIIGLYTDIFLGFIAPAPIFKLSVNTLSDMLSGKVILLYILFAMIAIFLFSVFTLLVVTVLDHCVRCNKASYDGILPSTLKTYALLTENSVADRLLREHEQNENNRFYNTMLKIAMAIMLSVDSFVGLYLGPLDENHGVFQIIFPLLSILIIGYQYFNYSGEKYCVPIDKECAKKIYEIVEEKTKLNKKQD